MTCFRTFSGLNLHTTNNMRNKSCISIYLSATGIANNEIDSLAPGKMEWNFRYVIFKRILVIDGWGISCEIALKPRSHIARNRSGTSLRSKFRVVAGRLQGGCNEVGDWSPTSCRDDLVARRFWLLQVKPLCDQINRRKFLVVADRLPTSRRLVGDWSPTSCSGCRQSRHSF